jgi:hypothetical protein
MRDYEIYPTYKDFFEYLGSTEIIRTPRLNGMGLISIIKKNFHNIPVIAITG